MTFEHTAPGHFEVRYSTEADMAPEGQAQLLASIEGALTAGAVSVLFLVASPSVPASVPKFWLEVTKRLAPGLCAMAVVSPSLVVRTAASGFSVSNRLRGIKVQVRAYDDTALDEARAWCADVRRQAIAPRR